MWRDLKYFLAMIVPASGYISLTNHGILTYTTLIIAFFIIPLLELFMKGNTFNFDDDEEQKRLHQGIFNFMLWLNIPCHIALLVIYFQLVSSGTLTTFELTGVTISMGIICGAIGINVAHELGHRENKTEQFLSKLLLTTSYYLHFFIEHNRGHHKNVSTDEDPASARFNEVFYIFFFRSLVGSYLSAWRIENDRVRKAYGTTLTPYNEMIIYLLVQTTYFIAIYLIWTPQAALFSLLIGFIGALMLETINYVEHYGLRRKKLPSGRYEKVMPYHSWNSNHTLGRILLYELTRHSDHHYKATRKYQILRHFDQSPQLPLGYPGSMILAWIPPLWFALMNKQVEKYNALAISDTE